MLKIKPSRTLLIGLIVGAGLVFVASGLGYWNRSSVLDKIQAEVSKKQEALENSEKIAKRLNRVEAEYTDAQMKLACLEQGVSTRAYVPTLLRQLEELGKNVNLKVVGVRPIVSQPAAVTPSTSEGEDKKEVKPKEEPYDKLDIDIEIHGKYWDVVRFLYKITAFPKIVRVNSFQASPAGIPNQPDRGSPVLSVKLNTTAFILKDEPIKSLAKPNEVKQASQST
ncbi:MAG: type 4a pilus biogenesis protein PilO [Armatimonadota bacterium]|nr:type 4a pilus biogenesis protein PilO [Armatimonadota bacterium]